MQIHGLGFLAAAALALAVGQRGRKPCTFSPIRVRRGDCAASRQGPHRRILVLHGQTSTAAWTAENSGFAEAALAHRFTAVFPQGIRKQWNDGREAQAAGVDDVGFLHRLVTALVGAALPIRRRIYIAGVSNGGMMTFRMLCESSELFAGAATVIANMPTRIGARCAPRKPVPVVMFNGTNDPLVPYDGGGVGFLGGRGSVWATEETAEFMADVNACEAVRALPLPIGSRVQVTRLEWTLCRTGSSVTLYRMDGAGHQVPGQRHSCRCSSAAAPGRCAPPTKPSRSSGAELHFPAWRALT